MITGNVIGGILKTPDTFILVDEEGNEYVGAVTGEETELDATVNDVRLGKTVALKSGVEVGEKLIPSYNTTVGYRVIPDGSEYIITALSENNKFDFTDLQALVCNFNTDIDDSVSTHKVSIAEKVYDVNSTSILSTIVKKHDSKTVSFGITNTSGSLQLLRYFTYKEI